LDAVLQFVLSSKPKTSKVFVIFSKVELHSQAKVMKMNKDILIFFQFIVIDVILIFLALCTFVLRWAEVTFTEARTFTSLFAPANKKMAAAVTPKLCKQQSFN
jgi:hypothetical protein